MSICSAKSAMLVLISTLLLVGCDDFYIISEYNSSEIEVKAHERKFSIGDALYDTSKYKKFCVLARRDNLNEYTRLERKVFFSEDFIFTLAVDHLEKEIVETVHYSWIVTPNGGKTLCARHPEIIVISEIDDNGRLHLVKTVEGRVSWTLTKTTN